MTRAKRRAKIKLERSELLGRKIRKDDWSVLETNSIDKIKEAIRKGQHQEAIDLVDYLLPEGKALHDLYTDWTYMMLSFIADRLGEEAVPEVPRYSRSLLSFTSLSASQGSNSC